MMRGGSSGEQTLLAPPSVLGVRLPSDVALRHLETLIRFDTSPSGTDHVACAAWIADQLVEAGFVVEMVAVELRRPLLVARRTARRMDGHVALYGHYDVAPNESDTSWTYPPRRLTLADGRLYARGVADNKGPLACRLAAVAALPQSPALTWLIQGEEETGSLVARAAFPQVMRGLSPTLWLDETGYHDHEDGTLRLLGRIVGPHAQSLEPDAPLTGLLSELRALASHWGIGARYECRGLNKSSVDGGCPFNQVLPVGARYLAIGVNDSRANIHAADESVPGWTFPLHTAELDAVFHWVNETAGAS